MGSGVDIDNPIWGLPTASVPLPSLSGLMDDVPAGSTMSGAM
jgi:hypothetical protein